MAHENLHHHRKHQLYHQNLQMSQRSTFLPMLCSRPSIKDVSLPRLRDHQDSFSEDPLSPRIGCMGQVKRNNKIAGFPTSSYRLSFASKSNAMAVTTIVSPVFVKYSKLKRLFSGKNLRTSTSSTDITVNGQDLQRNDNNNTCRKKSCDFIRIEDMDPPLPVMKKEEAKEVDSLWKRRSGGVALKSLQLQQIQRRRHYSLQPTSV